MSKATRDSIIQSIVTTSENVQRQWKALLVSEISGENITIAQLWALGVIAAHGSVNSRKLGEVMFVTSGAVTQLVDSLVAENYVLRQADSDDRRVTNLVLSEPGKKKFARLQQKRKGIFIKVFEVFSDQELSVLLMQQEKILLHLSTLAPGKVSVKLPLKSQNNI